MRASRLPALILPVMLLAAPLTGLAPTSVIPAATTAPASYQPALPVNATVFYPQEVPVPTRVHPTARVDANDVEVIRSQISAMQYAGQQVGIYSWSGRGTFQDQVFGNHLRAADDSTFRWSLLAESEGKGNPSVAGIRADLDSIYSRFGKDPSYFRVGGKPVLFTYGDAKDTCNAAARWEAADSSHRFYIVMKAVPGLASCRPKPQAWYGYAPGFHREVQPNSVSISPGFNKVGESRARLARSVSRFAADLRAMKAAKVRFKITTTWNEWNEATGVDTATEWRSRSGHGAYADQMHAILGQTVNPPAAPPAINATTSGDNVVLGWTATSGSTSYQVFRNGCQVATTTRNTWTDTSLSNSSASYFVKAVNYRGSSRRGSVRIGTAGRVTPAPVSSGRDGMVAIPGVRIFSTSTGQGDGCTTRQRGQAVLTLPGQVPATATGVVLDVTAVNAQGLGAVQLFGAGGAASVSQLRYYSSRAATNTVVVPIGTARQIVMQESGAATHLYVDVIGYTAPGEQSLESHQATVFLNTRSGSEAAGGTASKKLQGTLTRGLPSIVPDDAQSVEVRVMVSGADGPGTAQVFNGDTPPGISSLAYDTSVILTNSVIVPVTAGRTVSVNLSRNASVALAVEGWTTANGQVVTVGNHTLATSTVRHTAVDLTYPDKSMWGNGHLVLLNLGVVSALGYGNLTVTPDGDSAPMVQTVSYGPQQPQSGFVWTRIPANGVLHVALSSAALVYVDQVAVA